MKIKRTAAFGPSGGCAWETILNGDGSGGGGTVVLRIWVDPSNGGQQGQIEAEYSLTTAQSEALGSALGGSGGAASSTHGP